MRILPPSELIEKLKKNLGFKDDGSVEIAKNLEIDGKLKLNSGFEPIHTYSLEGTSKTFAVYFETLIAQNTYIFLGEYDNSIIIGFYVRDNVVNEFYAIGLLYTEQSAAYYEYAYGDENVNKKGLANTEALDFKQDKLTLHNLTLTANAKTYNITLQSTNNLPVDSVADLRTILNIKATTDSLITPVCSSDLTSTACLQVTTALCKIGADNVTAVSDKVTTL